LNRKPGSTIRHMGTTMDKSEALLRLLHLVSPTLPTGAFSYSQGLEWAVEARWLHDGFTMYRWLSDVLEQSMAFVDIPLFKRMYEAITEERFSGLEQSCSLLLACRETSELRVEEQTRGQAMATLLHNLDLKTDDRWYALIRRSQLAGFALAAVCWKIPLQDAALGYTWSWLENQVIAGVKTIPLGQTEGQRLLLELSSGVAKIVDRGLNAGDEDIGSASPALALACSLHESQYTRLYRS